MSVEELRVVDRINELFIATDQRAWDRVLSCFTPLVRFDMTSLSGGAPQTIAADEIVDGWKTGLAPLEQVHHQAGNHRVKINGDRADAFCYGVAWHYRKTISGRNTRTFVGSYDFHLVRDGTEWRIDAFRFNLKFIDGNLSLEAEA